MDLQQVSTGIKKRRLKKRVGRGIGSGHGKTSSRGHKGQYASAGAEMFSTVYAGGQTPIHLRIPKRGFSNEAFARSFAIVNVGDLGKFAAGTSVDAAALKASRIVNGTHDGIRVLGNGELTVKLTVHASHFTESAKKKIEGAGGTCVVIPPPNKPVRAKMGQGKNSAKKKPESK